MVVSTRTAAVAIDFSKAFDSIDHNILLTKICNSNLEPNTVRWLTNYLRGRTSSCQYLTSISRRRIVRSGVPQGAVLSPTLYNYFVADCPTPAKVNASYADDVTIAECHPDSTLNAAHLSAQLNEAIAPIVEWSHQNKLTIAPNKSSVTLFTPWNKQFNTKPQVLVNNQLLPLVRNPKILGVTLDPSFTFSPHVKNIIASYLTP